LPFNTAFCRPLFGLRQAIWRRKGALKAARSSPACGESSVGDRLHAGNTLCEEGGLTGVVRIAAKLEAKTGIRDQGFVLRTNLIPGLGSETWGTRPQNIAKKVY
jgi:hypothetical protein